MQLLVQTFMFWERAKFLADKKWKSMRIYEVNGICWSKLPYPEFNQSQVTIKKLWTAIQSNGDFLVTKSLRGRQLLVCSSAISEDKSWNFCDLWESPPAITRWLLPFQPSQLHSRRQQQWQLLNERAAEDGSGVKEDWLVLMLYAVYVTLLGRSRSPPWPPSGLLFVLYWVELFLGTAKGFWQGESWFFQSPKWLAERGEECLMIYQNLMPAITRQTDKGTRRWWRFTWGTETI